MTNAAVAAGAMKFRGQLAAASLKPDIREYSRDSLRQFRGQLAAASLKQNKLHIAVGLSGEFSGQLAAASLKRVHKCGSK